MNKLWKTLIAWIALDATSHASFVTIGNAGNAADSTGYGAVGYIYQISDHEVTIAEFQQAAGAGNGDENYWNDGTRTVGAGAPAGNVTLYEAMKYCNWLTSGNVDNGAYHFNGGVYQSTDRPAAIATYGIIYALPTEDEWFKAAYWTGDESDLWSLYANGTDTIPTWGKASGWNYYNDGYVNGSPNYMWESGCGGIEQNGTYDMMGNVWEWMESSGVIRGGGCFSLERDLRSSRRYYEDPGYPSTPYGFRVVMVPEPSTVLLFGIGGVGAWLLRRSRKKTDECDE
jgi:formylglycine-generating enzyme required for sulfatase activity